jgi:hypothetical protein
MTAAVAHSRIDAPPPRASDLAAVEDVVLDRHRAAGRGDVAALESLLHPVWCAKRPDGGEGWACETRAGFLARAGSRGAGGDALPVVTSAQMSCGDFAIVRTDEWAPPSARIHLLFKEHGVWRIAGEGTVAVAEGVRDARFTPRGDERDVLEVLGGYYDAVTFGDAGLLDRAFAPIWQMKNHQDGVVVAEDKPSFAARIAGRPLAGYRDDRQIADVQIVAGRLAYVRVDKPSSLSTTVFLFVKAGDRWWIVDKAWSARRPAR